MTISEHIAKQVRAEAGVIFGVTGGAIVNFVDALHKAGVKIIPTHHEQAAAMAADAYARVTGKTGYCFGTSGPGAGNLLTGLCCSYYDSVPVVAIGGQVPSKHYDKGGRQFGFQETHNTKIFKSVTKLSEVISTPSEFDTAVYRANSHRKGPVYVELFDDVQRLDTPYGDLKLADVIPTDYSNGGEYIYDRLSQAKKPIVILGAGIIQSGVAERAVDWATIMNLPVLLTWGAMDVMDYHDPMNMRDFGVTAQRAGNYALKYADLVLAIGTRLDTHMAGNYQEFAPNAELIIVEQDASEAEWKTRRDNTVVFREDLRGFILHGAPKTFVCKPEWERWRRAILALRDMFPLRRDDATRHQLGPYSAITALSETASDDSVVITDAGQTVTWTFQAWKVKYGQRLFTAFNHSPMGYSVPASIGAYHAAPNRPVTAITGDGGLMMNIQELATISGNRLPIRVVVIDNDGYGMIRQTLNDWSSLSKDVACGSLDGPYFPNMEGIAHAFEFDYHLATSAHDIELLPQKPSGPELIHIPIPKDSRISPKLKWGDKLERSTPHLTDEQERLVEVMLGY